MDAFWPLVAQQSEAHLNRLRELQKSEIGLVSGQGQTVDVSVKEPGRQLSSAVKN